MKFKFAIIFCSILLSGCATTPIPTSIAKSVPIQRIYDHTYTHHQNEAGQIVVKRDSGLGGSACNTNVYINGIKTAELASSEKITVFMPEGEYVLSAWPKNPCGGGMVEATAYVQINKTLVYRIGYGSNGDFGLYPTAF